MSIDQWISDLTKDLEGLYKLRDQGLHMTKSIFRVPKELIDVNEQAFEPEIASFGPYHHECGHLRPMEQHKHRAVIQFLRRIAKASKTPNDVVVAMRNVQPSLLSSYDALRIGEYFDQGHFHDYDWFKKNDEFLKLMIIDGCFALEIMLAEKRLRRENSEYSYCDPVFGIRSKDDVVPTLKRDMLLLENQLPLLALTTLAAIEGSEIEDVCALIKAFYNLPNQENITSVIATTENSFHILDIYRKVLTTEGNYLPNEKNNNQSAIKLKNVGVSFCKNKSRSFKDISFNDGVLFLPQLEIDDSTESVLHNLMAFERLATVTTYNEVTAYAFFMDGLIHTTNDVALLRNAEIIKGWQGYDEDIIYMFKRITRRAKLVVLTDNIQYDLNNNLIMYCKHTMNRWRVNFKNPWAFTSLLGGLFMIVLSIVQTVYTLLDYYYK